MGVAETAPYFHAEHAVAPVFFFGNKPGVDGLGKAGPAGFGIKFIGRAKQGGSRNDADVDSGSLIAVVCIAEGRFCCSFHGDLILEVGESGF